MDALKVFKKNNKERREVLAKKAGYNSAADYMNFLQTGEQKTAPKKQSKKKTIPTIHIVDVCDASASMDGAKMNSLNKGVKQQLEELQKVNDVNYTYTLLEFSGKNQMRFIHKVVPIKDVRHKNVVAQDWTALYAAIGLALDTLSSIKKKDEKVLVKIYTDGGENDSMGTKYGDSKTVAQRIKDAENEGFTVTFVGTDKDVKTVINKIKIDASNTLAYDGSAAGLQNSMKRSVDATMTFSKNVLEKKVVTTGFYKQTGKL